MAARRCSPCGYNWPADVMACICGAKTWHSNGSTPMDTAEAKRLLSNAAFDLWLTTPEGIAADERARLEGDRRDAEFAAIAQREEAA